MMVRGMVVFILMSNVSLLQIGPPRADDHENVVEGHGVLIAPAHPPVRKFAAARVKRDTRPDYQLSNRMEQFRGWPMEFDHLLMSPPVDKPNKSADAADVNRSVDSETSPFERRVIHLEGEYKDDSTDYRPKTEAVQPVAARSRQITIEDVGGRVDAYSPAPIQRELVIANSSMGISEISDRVEPLTTTVPPTTTTTASSTVQSAITQAPLILFE